ncbi:MAG: transcription-repair coupling factor [Phycisphaerae bacterium]|nr:transcription-repair coupling factor [Phycisphaerae bacterium]
MDLLRSIRSLPTVKDLARLLTSDRHVVASGASGSSTHLLAAAVALEASRPVLLVLAHVDEADDAADELSGLPVVRLPGLEVLPGETNVSAELFAERLAAVRAVASWPPDQPAIVVAPIQALMQTVPGPASLPALARIVSRGDSLSMADLARWLAAAGYTRTDAADEPGDFAIRGGIMDVFPASGRATLPSGEPAPVASPIRLDFFGDQLDRLHEVDPDTMGSTRELASLEVVAATAAPADEGVPFASLLPRGTLALIAETMEVTEQGRGYYERVSDARGVLGPPAVLREIKERCPGLAEVNQFSAGAASADARIELPFRALPSFHQDAAEAVMELGSLDGDVLVLCQNPGELQRFHELLAEFAPAARVESHLAYLHRGFVVADHATPAAAKEPPPPNHARPPGPPAALFLVPYHELLHRYHTRRHAVRLRAARAIDTFLDFEPGDIVVHAEHGIARYLGLKPMKPGARGTTQPNAVADAPAPSQRGHTPDPQEYLVLEFASRAKLLVPAANIDQIQKYVGGFKGKPQLSTLGGTRWKSQKDRVAESVKDLAAELLRVRAAREHMPGIRFPADTAWQREFEAEFPYEPTDDQAASLAEIKRDMQADRPMDRLVCGDVGFGKTELAIRAAFKAVEFGKQVAVLVPTTVLAEQHERTFRARFADYPFRVESVSRFKTAAEANHVLAALRKGHVDIIIGTHRLLSGDVKFADLGLVVIDEEQRFGVEHKEKLLRLRMTVDVLTLSATPIPRTLHMSMLGLRDISSLTTAPLDRRAIVTEVIPYNERRLAQAIARELTRDGQVYFVHNRVHNIRSVADQVQRLAPDARIVIGHGQMTPSELEDAMLRFMRRDADILVSTTIIESGIDIPTANTMIINDADRFGLADLHQLRGRVGRSKHRAYCYMLLPSDRAATEIAQKRLKAIEQYSMLGAGFKIAMRDLEIRGAGNLLGAEQSGHIAAVGYEMYCRLLEQATRDLTNQAPPATASAAALDLGITGTIPKTYIPSDLRRLEAYRRVATAATLPDLARVADDFRAAYGDIPAPTRRLLDLAELRVHAASLGVRTVSIRGLDLLFRTDRPDALAQRLCATRFPPPTKPRPPRFSERPSNATEPRPAPAAVRVLPPPSGERLHEVYLRLPPSAFEPDSLLAILRRRLAPAEPPTATPAPAPPPPAPRTSTTRN